jgi:ketosteroid isomerase-like protein
MRIVWIALIASCLTAQRAQPQDTPTAARAGIDRFNKALDAATLHMDNAATLALWEEDGVSLLPQTPPVIGKKAIAKFLDDVMAGIGGAKMEKFELECFDIDVTGTSATEWCNEHQIVQLPGDKKFDGRGRMLLVLHQAPDGVWRMKREMWNQATP